MQEKQNSRCLHSPPHPPTMCLSFEPQGRNRKSSRCSSLLTSPSKYPGQPVPFHCRMHPLVGVSPTTPWPKSTRVLSLQDGGSPTLPLLPHSSLHGRQGSCMAQAEHVMFPLTLRSVSFQFSIFLTLKRQLPTSAYRALCALAHNHSCILISCLVLHPESWSPQSPSPQSSLLPPA